MIITELQWITYLSLVALGIVTYLYIRQRNENNQRLRNYLQEPDYYPVTTKPGPDSLNRSFPGPGQSVPPFSQQDGFQRRPVNDFDIRNPNQSILRTTSPFDDVNVSRLDNKSRDFDQSRITDRSFERKYIPYEPSREVGSYQPVSRQEQPVSHDKPHWSRIDSSISEIVTYPAANGNISKEIVYTKEEIIEENPIPVDRRENRRNLDEDPIHNYPELENEYKVFKDLKLREGRRFHDEPKKDGSPMRSGKRMSALDRVGHSPDSPFKMFESPANSKKKLNGNHQDAGKPTRPHHALVSKKDSFARTQEALNQKSKGPVRTVPHNQRSTQVLANQRNERKAKLNQVFIENNNSEDEMLVEEQKDPFTKNKRSTLPGRSIDNYEKEIPNKKVIKTSDHHPKGKTVEAKKVPVRNSYGGEEVQKPKVPANKKPSVDLSYMTEFGRNSSLQKYVEKKTRMDETMKSNRNSSPVPSSKAMNIEKSPQAPTQKTQDKANAGQFKPPSSLARREDVVSNTREEKEMVSQKPAVKETKGLFETKNDVKPEVGSKDAGVKPEGAKISSILGGSSIFSQPKAEASSEKAEKEEPTSNKPPSDLFKTMKPGMSISGASGDSKDQPPSKIPHVEPSDEKKEETRKAYVGSLFSTDIKDEKKAETAGEKTQEDNAKPTQLGLFKSGGSLFSGFNTGGSLFSNPKSENQGNTAADDKKEAPKVTSGLFSHNKTPEVNTGDGQKAEEKPKTGLFAPTSGTGLFAGLKTENKTGLSPGGLFGNLSSVTGPKDSGESVKKDDPLAAFAKKPEVDEAKPKLLFSNLIEAKPAEAGADTKPKGLFSNAGGISGDLFKTNYSKIGGSGLFAGSGKDDKPTTGLFANLNNGNSSNEKTS